MSVTLARSLKPRPPRALPLGGREATPRGASGGTTTYGYDPLGQLIEAKRGGYHEVFEYDVTGSLQNILSSLDQVGHVAPWKLEPGNVLTEREGVRYENDRNTG